MTLTSLGSPSPIFWIAHPNHRNSPNGLGKQIPEMSFLWRESPTPVHAVRGLSFISPLPLLRRYPRGLHLQEELPRDYYFWQNANRLRISLNSKSRRAGKTSLETGRRCKKKRMFSETRRRVGEKTRFLVKRDGIDKKNIRVCVST